MKIPSLSVLAHSTLLILTIVAAFVWISTPFLAHYSLQAFSVSALGFFTIKRFNKAKIWHILPESHSYEMIFVTFATLLLVASTGNAESIFYPFTYIHLFFLVMSSKEQTAIIVTTATVIFHYAVEPAITSTEIAAFMTIPLMLLFFLFARKQYDDAQVSRSIIEKDEEEIRLLTAQEHTLESFISTFLRPKIAIIMDMLSDNSKEDIDSEAIRMQVSLMASESEKILDKVKTEEVKP